jgi:hypothetical protein
VIQPKIIHTHQKAQPYTCPISRPVPRLNSALPLTCGALLAVLAVFAGLACHPRRPLRLNCAT